MNQVILNVLTSGVTTINHTFSKGDRTINLIESMVVYTSKSGTQNHIRVMYPEEHPLENFLSLSGLMITLEGELRSFRKEQYGKRISELYIRTNKFLLSSNAIFKNEISLKGKIVKEPFLKKRKNGLDVGEALLKVQRSDGINYDYLPIVTFGKKSNQLLSFQIGDCIDIQGRIHSRMYPHIYTENGTQKEVTRIAYEVAVHEFH